MSRLLNLADLSSELCIVKEHPILFRNDERVFIVSLAITFNVALKFLISSEVIFKYLSPSTLFQRESHSFTFLQILSILNLSRGDNTLTFSCVLFIDFPFPITEREKGTLTYPRCPFLFLSWELLLRLSLGERGRRSVPWAVKMTASLLFWTPLFFTHLIYSYLTYTYLCDIPVTESTQACHIVVTVVLQASICTQEEDRLLRHSCTRIPCTSCLGNSWMECEAAPSPWCRESACKNPSWACCVSANERLRVRQYWMGWHNA